MRPLISVIVAIYNVENYLDTCIESILKQTYSNLEVILVDDGSSDNCGEICDNYSKKDHRIVVVHKKNGGLSSARNAGLDIARGEYIGFIDSDDYIEDDMYRLLINNALNNNADISICGRYYLHDKKIVIRSKQDIFLIMNSEEAICKMNTFGYYDVASWDKIYKKELFNEIRFPVGELSEDWFTTYKLIDRASRIVYDSTPKYYYRQREGSITHSKNINYNPIAASKEVLDLVKEKYPNNIMAATTAYVFASILVYNDMLLFNKKNIKKIKDIKQAVHNNYKLVIKNNDLGFSRSMKIRLLYYSPIIYNFMFKISHTL